MNEATRRLIEAAKARTAKLLEEQAAKGTGGLPSAVDMSQKEQAKHISEQINSSPTLMKLGMNSFDPYDIPGVGRANKEQAQAIKLFGIEGKSGCLIGPAGTGKTTTMRAALNAAVLSGRIPILSESLVHKYLRGGLPGIYGGSFTRIATRNLRNNFPPDLQSNVHTLHRLLEFEPEIVTVTDPKTGDEKNIRMFKPTRNQFRPFDSNLVSFWLDESSMIGYTRLHTDFINAIHPQAKNVQIVYIGDIAQIPPVMDDAVLGYKMLEFIPLGQLVELVQVYRHAGAIVNLANRIRVGATIPNGADVADIEGKKQFNDERYMLQYHANPRKLPFKYTEHAFKRDGWTTAEDKVFVKEEDGSKVTVKFWKNRLDGEVGQLKALQNLGIYDEKTNQKGFFIKEIEAGNYNPLTDMILMPYNKSVGTIELNKYIANYLGKLRGAEVHEIIAGYSKHYLAVGDKIFYEREEAIITKIVHNGMYAGRIPQAASVTLDRWGHNLAGTISHDGNSDGMDDVEMILSLSNIDNADEERKNQASHIVYCIRLVDMEEAKKQGKTLNPETDAERLSLTAHFNSMGPESPLFSYALTIHKSQGSQWPKVYCVFHNSHNRNLQRELLYTAITRAQKELFVIAEPETFVQGVMSQHIVGNTLAEKAEYFKGKVAENDKRNDLFQGKGK